MVEIIELIKAEVEKELKSVEEKLRNSFKHTRMDIKLLGEETASLSERIDQLFKEGLSKPYLESSLNQTEAKFSEKLNYFLENHCKKFEDMILSFKELKKSLSKTTIRRELERQLLAKLKEELMHMESSLKKRVLKKEKKKTDKALKKMKDRADYLTREFYMFRNEFVSIRKELEQWKQEIGRELKEILDRREEQLSSLLTELKNQVISLKAKNTLLSNELAEMSSKKRKNRRD
jgi:chromosome segregation ATPase